MFLKRLRGSWFEPSIALVFATSGANRYINDMTRAFGKGPYSPGVMDRIAACLPKSCLLLLGGARGVVGTPCEVLERGVCEYGSPLQLVDVQAFSALLLPAHPPDGVHIQPFVVTEDHARNWKQGKNWYSSLEFKKLVGLPTSNEAQGVKCTLMFAIDDLDYIKSDLADMVNGFIDNCGASNFAFGGAVLNLLLAAGSSPMKGRVICMGFCFSGDAVRSASLLLTRKDFGAKATQRQLWQLKRDSGFDGWKRGSTVAFMFASMERFDGRPHRSNMEADAFAQVFPGVPLMGFLDRWQIGNRYAPHLPTAEPSTSKGRSKRRDSSSYLFVYSTIIVLLSLGTTELGPPKFH